MRCVWKNIRLVMESAIDVLGKKMADALNGTGIRAIKKFILKEYKYESI